MPDRRRVAVVVTPLLALLAALLAGWNGVAAQAPDPLTLTITASRAECTAATLNPVTWTIAGGAGPYTVTVDGEPVAAGATSANATCGILPEPGDGETPVTEAPGAITATVTDATGATATASAAYTIVPPLPAPTGLEYSGVLSYQVTLEWDAVDGAGGQSPPVQNRVGRDEFDSYLLRYPRRPEAEATAPYEFVGLLQYPFADVRPGPLDALSMPTTTGDYLGMVAAIRHTIEQETPAALQWSAPVQFGVARAPENIVARATHDTLDVSWDTQPYTQTAVVWLVGGGLHQTRCCVGSGITVADGRQHARFRHLTPDTEYEITIRFGDGVDFGVFVSETTARTSAAPADWEPLPRGPQNLRVTTTHDSIIVHWDPPFPEAPGRWFVGVSTIFNGTAWSVAQRTIRTPLPAEGVTLRGDPPALIRPNTTYTVLVAHRGFDGAAAEISVTTPAAPPALRLTLAAERAECTAGTLNPVTWEITGGAAPYRLTLDGASVDAGAEGATVTCGALPGGASEAAGTITASVTDAPGSYAEASAAYTIVPPLPAPTNFVVGPHPGFVLSSWERVRGAGSQFPEFDASQLSPAERRKRNLDGYLVRYRTDAASAWTYAEHSDGEYTTQYGYLRPWDTPPPGTFYTASVAAARHPLELETPEALNWSAPIRYTTSGPAQNLTVRATHNTVTVSWSKQPGTGHASAHLWNPRGGGELRILAEGDEPGTHTVTFNHLEPNSEYKIWIFQLLGDGRGAVSRSFRTAAAPPDWQPLPRGPQNLRATATHDTITVTWDPPFEGASPKWSMAMLDGEILVHSARVSDGTTTWVSSGEVDSIGRYRIRPNTTYTIIVRHHGVRRVEQTITVTTQAAPPPLGLTLTASRAECTAGTLNPVSWEISGGVEPYRLTVDGASVDADAEGAHATCGALPDYGSWLPVTQAPGTIRAVVTDAEGTTATASAAYTIVPPLPAPANFQVGPHPGVAYTGWDSVRGAGSQYPEFDASQLSPAERDQRLRAGYLVRYRTDATSAWTYAEHSDGEWTTQYGYVRPWETPPPGTFYTASVAAARHPLELETPAALNWSAPIRYSTPGPAQNLTVRATHNSVTVSWSKQPGTGHASAHLWNPRGGGELRILTEGDEPGTHTVTFNHLEPNSEYQIWIFQLLGDGRAAVSRSFRTAAAPPDWHPRPRGPQNLRATATHDTITVTWDPPFEGASPRWSAAMLDGEILVHILESNDGTTTWVSSGEVDSIGRYRIRPNTTYTIIVRHHGVRRVEQTITVTTQAAPPPLGLTLTASRPECTAGTLNPVSWEIRGGVAPYRLTVDGASVDADAESATVTCGTLADYGSWLPVTEAPGTITATVRDAAGAWVSASAAYTIVPPLPAPTGVTSYPLRTAIALRWDRVPGTGPTPTLASECPCPLYFVRWRPTGTETWTTIVHVDHYSNLPGAGFYRDEFREGTTYEFVVAALRDTIEQDTPTALTWSASVTASTLAPPTGVRAVATHDTITVTWDPQPAAGRYAVSIWGPDGSTFQQFTPDADAPHRVVFHHLPPDTEYTVEVAVEAGPQSPVTEITVSTTAAPPGWTALPRGPQNLRTSVTHNSVTVDWDAPYAGARDTYQLWIFHTGADREPTAQDRHEYSLVEGAGITEHTFTGLARATTYVVYVEHPSIVSGTVRVAVTTAAASAPAQSTSPTLTCIEYLVGAVVCT